jgi:PAS domain S-box-containing protein
MNESTQLPFAKDSNILNSSSGPFYTITQNIPDAVVILDSSMQMVYVNSAAETMFGYKTEEMIGKPADILIPAASLEAYHDFFQKMVSDRTVMRRMGETQPVYIAHRDGHSIPVDISASQYEWQNIKFITCVIRDMAGYIAQQQALSESEQRYLGMIESQTALVVRVDRQGLFTFVNQAYCKMFGKRPEELIGRSFTPLIHPNDLAITLEAMKGLEQPPYRITVAQRALTAKGWRWISWEDCVIQDEAGNRYEIQGVGYDITEQKRAEEITLIERNLAVVLAQKSTIAEALPVCLDLAIQVSDMDCGEIFMVGPENRDLVLKVHKGLSPHFIEQFSRYTSASDRYRQIMEGKPIYHDYLHTPVSKNQIHYQEGLRSFVLIPIQFNGEVIACINVASHTMDEIPELRRSALEYLAVQLGNMLVRFLV